jgi:hypothetical protein
MIAVVIYLTIAFIIGGIVWAGTRDMDSWRWGSLYVIGCALAWPVTIVAILVIRDDE